MIAFGCISSDERRFRAGAVQAIEAVAETDSLLLRHVAQGTYAEPCDAMLAEAARRDDLEALVLLDQDVTGCHRLMPATVRRAFAADPELAILDATPPALRAGFEGAGAVLIALSPVAVRELRCDPTASRTLDLLALDLRSQACTRGWRVASSGDLVASSTGYARGLAERRAWVQGMAAVRRKWTSGSR